MDLRGRVRAGIDGERIAVWTVAVLVVAASLVVAVVGTPYTAPPDQLREASTDPAVTVTATDSGYVLAPARTERSTALVFYPGGRVDPDAYVPVLAPVVAETDVTIFVPRPPLHLAVFDPGMAAPKIDANPSIDRWYVGGHSLGGAMACRFADRNPDRVTGLVLLGSYCDRDVSGSELRVLTVRGGRDAVVDRRTYRRTLGNLPETRTTAVTIPGMNHSQFGAYGGQPGDRPATIATDRAHAELRGVLIAFLTGENVSVQTAGQPSETAGDGSG